MPPMTYSWLHPEIGKIDLEQQLPVQPRPAAVGVALRRRPALPGAVRQAAGDVHTPAAGHAVRIPGRRARHDQRGFRAHRRLSRYRDAQPVPRAGAGKRNAPPWMCCRFCTPRAGTMPAHRCSGTRASGLVSRPVNLGSSSNPITSRSMCARRWRIPNRYSITTRC